MSPTLSFSDLLYSENKLLTLELASYKMLLQRSFVGRPEGSLRNV